MVTTEGFIDTNIFIRFFVGDISHQFQEAKEIFTRIEEKQTKGYVSLLVINEIIWILEHYYALERKVYIPQLLQLLLLENIKVVEVKKELVVEVLKLMMKQKYDFTDIYLTKVAEGSRVYSFDRDFEKMG